MARKYNQGIYEVVNKEKYMGQSNPRYLSSYELAVWKWCDRREDVLKWGAETVIVPYYSSVKGRKARYIVDLYMEYVDRSGNVKKVIVEIKPSSQTKTPSKSTRKKRSTVIEEGLTWVTNNEKWAAAEKYAADRGWEFKIFTEKEIFG